MRKFGKWLGRLIILLVLIVAGAWAFVPQDPVDRTISFDAATVGPDIDAWLAAGEKAYPDIVPGTEKRVIWAGEKGKKTPLSVIYIHGFSATSEEIRPVPDQVAKTLGANLFYTRLAGHGRGGDPMATASAGDWLEDTAEALAIGRQLGDRVLVIATSTGATLAAYAAVDPAMAADIAGIVMVSPNFGVKPAAAKILDLPAARYWGPVVAGATRSFNPVNAGHAKYWTAQYPTAALFPMAALVRDARTLDLSAAKTPLMVIYSAKDSVVDAEKTLLAVKGWSGPVRLEAREIASGDDPYFHVIAGDILSPGQTAGTVALILDWAKGL